MKQIKFWSRMIPVVMMPILMSCGGSKDESKYVVTELQVISTPQSPIIFFEDTVYINKSGGIATGFLSPPLLTMWRWLITTHGLNVLLSEVNMRR